MNKTLSNILNFIKSLFTIETLSENKYQIIIIALVSTIPLMIELCIGLSIFIIIFLMLIFSIVAWTILYWDLIIKHHKKILFILVVGGLLSSGSYLLEPSDIPVPASISNADTIDIIFAGNLSYGGGPYYITPTNGTSGTLAAAGYFANGSCIPSDEMEISADITDGDGVSSAYIHWYNMTSNEWDNTTQMYAQGGTRYEGIIGGYSWDSPDTAESDQYRDADAWINPGNSIDDDITSDCGQCSITGGDYWLYLNLSSSINCDKIRIMGWCNLADVITYKIEVYFDDGWNEIHNGELPEDVWNVIEIGEPKSIQYCRIDTSVSQTYVTEFDFCNVDTSSSISAITPGDKYSFDVFYTDGLSNTYTQSWVKNQTSDELTLVRRCVYLDDVPNNDGFEYTPWYTWNITTEELDTPGGVNPFIKDALWRDQMCSGANDWGLLRTDSPLSETQFTFCGAGIYFPIDLYNYSDRLVINSTQITNVYFRNWWSNNTAIGGNSTSNIFSLNFTRGVLIGLDKQKTFYSADNRAILNVDDYIQSSWMYDAGFTWLHFIQLATGKLSFTDTDYTFDSNSIYNLHFYQQGSSVGSWNNESYMSYLLFNIPDNTTLQGMDTDDDGLSDYNELFLNYTSPFHADTDNDGNIDKIEILGGTDPNVYTNYTYYPPWIHDEVPVNGSVDIPFNPTCNITATDNNTGDTLNVTWQSNYSDGSTWVTYQVNSSVSPEDNVKWDFTDVDSGNTKYWWRVYVDDDLFNVSKTFHFTTIDTYDEQIRPDGLDYFVWLGDNCTVVDVGNNITGFDDASESLYILDDDGTWDGIDGEDSGEPTQIVNTFDVIKVIMDDGPGEDITITMIPNSDYISSYENRTFDLIYVAPQGVNFTVFTNGDSSTLGTEADEFLETGEIIALWNETNYNWDFHQQGVDFNSNKQIHLWDVCYTRITSASDEVWDQS